MRYTFDVSDHANLLGRVVAGKFQVEERIGRGAMGEVFRARHIVLDTVIALKIMREDIAEQAMFKERFYREAKAASRLDHPNSVRVLDFGVEPDGLVYIAMEFLHGRDLLGVLREEWPLADERIVEILTQTLAAVSVAHELGIIHRDLKPENIMVNVGPEDDEHSPWQVKVLDFGIAKLSDPRSFVTENGGSLTSSGTLIGTPEYMSPEQSRGDSLDPRSDIYSVGIVLYQLLVGRVPFIAENALGVVLKQVTDEPVPPTEVRPGVNPRLEAICLRALKKNRNDRYQSAKDMRRDLRAVFGYAPNHVGEDSGARLPPVKATSARGLHAESAETIIQFEGKSAGGTQPMLQAPRLPTPPPPPRRHLGSMIGVAVVALLVGSVGVFFVASRRHTSSTLVQAIEEPSALASLPPPLASPTNAAPSEASGEITSPVVAPSAPFARHAGPPKARPSSSAIGAPAVAAIAPATASAPVATGPAAQPFNPSTATVMLGALTTERVRDDAIRKKTSALQPQFTACYQDALRATGAPKGGSVQIQMSIDEHGNVTPLVLTKDFPSFASCAQRLMAGLRIDPAALDTGGGGNATQWLTLRP